MTFTTPLFLLALLPWGALAVYLMIGRRKRVAVPFVELWKTPIRPKRTTRALHAPPVSVVLILLAMLAAVVAAGGLAVKRAIGDKKTAGAGAATRPVRNVAITHVAARERPARQILLRLRNESSQASVPVRVTSDSTVVLERELELPASGMKDYFLDVEPALGPMVSVELVVDDDMAWDNRGVLARERPWPRVEARASMPQEVQRVAEAYSRARPASEASARVELVAEGIPGGAGVIVAPRSASNAEAGEVRITPHAVTARLEGLPAAVGDAVVAGPPGDLGSWTTLIAIGGKPALLVREAPARQVYVGFHSEPLARAPEFVYLWTNILDWTGGAADDALVARPISPPAGAAVTPKLEAGNAEGRRLGGAVLIAALTLALLSALLWRRGEGR